MSMPNPEDDIRSIIDESTPTSGFVELGMAIDPVLAGDDEGYIERAKDFLRREVCTSPCDFLVSKPKTELAALTATIADVLLKALGVHSPVPVSVVWKVSATLAKHGLPATLDCATCPLKAIGSK